MADAVKEVVDKVKNLTTSDKPQKQQGKKKEKKGGDAPKRASDELNPPPDFLDHRIAIFNKLKAEYDASIASKPRDPITVSFPDGKNVVGAAWETTPGILARNISKSLYERIVVAEVDSVLWDLERPLESNCALKFLTFDDPKGREVFWHSSAHVLGECSELCLGAHLANGPPTSEGFYYDLSLQGATVLETDFEPLERTAAKVVKEKQTFDRLSLSKENLLEMFKYNKYKVHLINDKIPDNTFTTVYKNGRLIDLCRGPHIPHTGRIKAFKVMKASASYFLGDQKNDSLQRIYGVSFPDKKLMDEHMKYLEEAAKRDHRKIGIEQELFFFNPVSPGSTFWLPHGMIIYNTIQEYIRSEYWKRGYKEVLTPNMFSSELWKQSGHWQHYSEDMFVLDVDKEKFALKPMNCPGHCVVFGFRNRSYHELPLRMAEFGVLHRNEASGALSGLTRVRRFAQDDTHIFCTPEQIGTEMEDLYDFLREVYGKFGFTFKLKLSTRPEKFLGDIATWDSAEDRLQKSLEKFAAEGGAKWEMNPGDGAFYGPKIDITIQDALKRDFQCATIQLDFQLPEQFGLEYMTGKTGQSAAAAPAPVVEAPAPAKETPASSDPADTKAEPKKTPKPLSPGYARPVMIHRAIVGSLERFIGVLTEHLAGRWPFWVSPRQILVIPVMPAANDYTLEVQTLLRAQHFHCDVDIGPNTMQKKIRQGQLSAYNFIFVVGAQERESRTVNIRNRDDPSTQAKGDLVPLDVAIEKLVKLRDSKQQENKI